MLNYFVRSQEGQVTLYISEYISENLSRARIHEIFAHFTYATYTHALHSCLTIKYSGVGSGVSSDVGKIAYTTSVNKTRRHRGDAYLKAVFPVYFTIILFPFPVSVMYLPMPGRRHICLCCVFIVITSCVHPIEVRCL